MGIALVATAVLVIVLVALGAYVVQQQSMAIIERLGKYHAITGPGLHVKIPAR